VLIAAFTYAKPVSYEVAQATTSIVVSASKTRQISRAWSADFEAAIKAIPLVQTVVGAMH
jgi:hypothetical protein